MIDTQRYTVARLEWWIHRDTQFPECTSDRYSLPPRVCEWQIHSLPSRVIPQTEEIGLQIIATAKISNKFSRESPYISNTISQESPNFHTSFYVCKRSPRHSKNLSGKLIDLEIEIFEVWSPGFAGNTGIDSLPSVRVIDTVSHLESLPPRVSERQMHSRWETVYLSL